MSVQSHFFIESGGFSTQDGPTQSFGPVSPTKFRLTSKFTITESKKAFSICKGVVLIQPQTGNSNKVNLILRPYKQPFPGLNIKYFIYRGLKKSDFFTTATEPLIIATNGTSTSDFINKINTDFSDFNKDQKDANGNLPPFTAKYIGYNPSVDDDVALSSFFFKESEFVDANGTFEESDAFELPLIDAGKSLGNFYFGDNSECGIDVVLNYGDYKHNFDNGEFDFNLEYARAAEANIELSGDAFSQKLQREQSTQFIDIAAFYGLFVPKDSVGVVTAGALTEKKGSDIYTSIINKFATKNNWYVYIQSDRTRSYDFYGNYKISATGPENLKTGLIVDATAHEVITSPVTYGTLGWPVMINTQQQTAETTTNNLYLQFTTDNNNNTAFYGQIANVANAQKDNFINADGLIIPPDADGNYQFLTSKVQLTTPAVAGQNIATLNILLYQGIINQYDGEKITDENGQEITLTGQANFFDDVFNLIHAKPLLTLSGDQNFSRMTSEKLNLINEFYDKKQQGISVVQTLTVNDVIETGIEEIPPVARVTYLTEAADVMNNAVSASGSTTPDTKTTASASGAVTQNKTYELPDPYYYTRKIFTDGTQTITGLELKTLDGSTPAKIILGLTKTENNTIIKVLITNDLKNPRLFLIDLFQDGNELFSPENIKYRKYKVAIVAEGQDGKKILFKPEDDVFVYSLDRNYHFSKGYSEHMPDPTLAKLRLDLNIKLDIE